MRPNRLTVKQADGHYHIYDHTVINETSCCDEYNRNAFSLYEGTAIDKLGQYEDLEEHDATEQAYRNGYDAGYKAAKDEIVRCKDCIFSTFDSRYSRYICLRFRIVVYSDDFCNYGKIQ